MLNFDNENFFMKLLLDIRDDKAPQFLRSLKSLKYIKTTRISPAKALLIKEMKDAVHELNLVKQGKKKSRKAENFLNEL
jgi:hypothetical protein